MKRIVREYKLLDIRIITVILMLISFFIGAKMNGTEYVWTCWKRTMPPSEATWHPIPCPKWRVKK